MVRLIMGAKGAGKTKRLIGLINESAVSEAGSVVCIEAGDGLTYDVDHRARLINAHEYSVSTYESFRGFISGLYAGNYDISHVFIDNFSKIVGDCCSRDTEDFLHWLDKFSFDHNVKFTVTISADPDSATDGMQKYL
ncbi:MAG: ATP-binding protein [Oscillospiraceae bacterium]|nr:ATP-binding protein [Oscillospiraceae bacterium]